MDGLYKLTKEQTVDPVLTLAQWLIEHNPNKPGILCKTNDKLLMEIEEMKKLCDAWNNLEEYEEFPMEKKQRQQQNKKPLSVIMEEDDRNL